MAHTYRSHAVWSLNCLDKVPLVIEAATTDHLSAIHHLSLTAQHSYQVSLDHQDKPVFNVRHATKFDMLATNSYCCPSILSTSRASMRYQHTLYLLVSAAPQSHLREGKILHCNLYPEKQSAGAFSIVSILSLCHMLVSWSIFWRCYLCLLQLVTTYW